MGSELFENVRSQRPIWRQWTLIRAFGERDLKSKFKGTALGWLWSLMVPLATLGIYSLVFSIIFRTSPPPMGGDPNKSVFALWLFAGLIMWGFFQNSINAGITGLTSSGGLIQKVYFPAYAPILGAGLAVGIQSLIELSLLLVVLIFYGNIGFTWLLALPLVALYTIFCWSLAVIFSIANAFLRDMAHLIGVILQLLFYLTPIIYSVTFVPARWHGLPLQTIIASSPLSSFIDIFRDLVYGLNTGSLFEWAVISAWTLVAALLATWVHGRWGSDLGERL